MIYVTRLCGITAIVLAFASTALAAVAAPDAPPTPLPRPFGRGEAVYHKTEFAPYRFENTIVRVSFDVPKGIVYGDETAVVVPKRNGLQHLPFNTLGIRYDAITADGRAVAHHFDPAKQLIYVDLPAPAPAGRPLRIEFRYSAAPQRGIYFIRPDKGYPNVTPEIWSQGETLDNRRWFPTWDQPNEKTPSELIVTVPRGWTVVGNGYLKGRTPGVATQTWDWNAPHPKSTYLIAFAAGPLAENHTALRSLAVDSYVQPPYAKINGTCFGVTKDIVAFFQQRIGVPFPWEKEDQITAERFTAGGMENASATIQTDRVLHQPSEEALQQCDGLIAHELAHQWWGDDVSMADWANVWIAEGYATYFASLWSEHARGEAQFELERYRAQQTYFGETDDYWRPIVDYVYRDENDVFDASGYQRPGQVLHMMRYLFGDERFFGALRTYLQQYRYKNADTHQFFASMDTSLGTDLTWFENEWFYRDCYPNYVVTQRYDSQAQTLTLDVTQKNHDGKPFRMPIAIEVYAGGQVTRVKPTIDQNHQVVTISGVSQQPQMVLFDPNNNVLRQLTFTKSVDELAYQATHAQHVPDRLWALEQLTASLRDNRQAASAAIAQVALHDPFFAVRAAAVGAAARAGDTPTVIAAMHDTNLNVVASAAQAAGALRNGKDPQLATELHRLAGNPHPAIAGAALGSIGALKLPDAYDLLTAALHRPSFRNAIASAAMRGLGALGDMRAFATAQSLTRYGTEENLRAASLATMTRLALLANNPLLVEPELLALAKHDPLYATRAAAAGALGRLGDTSVIPVLRRIEADDVEPSAQNAAYNAILTIKDTVAQRAYRAKTAAAMHQGSSSR